MTDVLEVMNRELMMELYEVKKKLRWALKHRKKKKIEIQSSKFQNRRSEARRASWVGEKELKSR